MNQAIPNPEPRTPKEIRAGENRNAKRPGLTVEPLKRHFASRVSAEHLSGLRILNMFQISDFGIWIFPASLAFLLATAPSLHAYPEFRAFIVQHSGRPVDCAMCHVSHDGPQGTGPGQIGSLTPAGLEELGRARTAFASGSKIKNPILNAFGNHIVQSIGLTRFRELRLAPAELAKVLPQDSDLDGDGIPDVQEYLDGTSPVDKDSGLPWLLFKHNFKRNLSEICLTLAATAAGLYGLSHLLRGFARAAEAPSEDERERELEPVKSELS